MKIVLFVAILVVFAPICADEATTCPVHKCVNDIADKGPEVGRTCAVLSDTSSFMHQNKFLKTLRYLSTTDDNNMTTVFLQPWGREDLECDLNFSYTKNATCQSKRSGHSRVPGEICNKDSDWTGSGNCTSGVCVGKPVGSVCDEDSDCETMLFCNNGNVCAPVAQVKEACNETIKCTFGSAWYNGKCTANGTVVNKKAIPSENYEGLCATFFADQADDGNFYCGLAPDEVYDNYTRTYDNLSCSVIYYTPVTEETTTKIFNATCGPNSDSSFYCPKFRGDYDFRQNIKEYKDLWKNNFTCHIDSTFYCKDLIDKEKQNTLVQFAIGLMETDSESYPTYANNPDCVKSMYNTTYWELMDILNSSCMGHGFILMGLISILILSFMN